MTSSAVASASFSTTSKELHQLVLRDGRTLAWREYGAGSEGFPVVFTHGNLNSRLFQPSWENSESDAVCVGAHVLAVDRPGYGLSSAKSGRTYVDWAMDVAELVRYRNIHRFSLVGFSSGGPHALAAASVLSRFVDGEFKGRIAACGLVSSDAPYQKVGGDVLVERMYGKRTVTMEYALQRAERVAKELREVYNTMQNKGRKNVALSDLEEATKTGFEGAASDAILEASSNWGFKLKPASDVPVLLWHGTQDDDVPVEAARYLLEACGCGNNSGRIIVGESHTLIRRHWRSILGGVVSAGCKSNL